MRFPHLFETIGGLTLVALSLIATPGTAQTVISNETLVTTTFVVNKKIATAQCGSTGCRAKTSMFAPIPVTCPAASGQTCTLHISLDTKVLVNCNGGNVGSGPTGFYEFLVDGLAPTIGPTEKNGEYIFEQNVTLFCGSLGARQSYPASVLATVTNSKSNQNHTIVVNVGCAATNPNDIGCEATSHSTTMRVDVFEP
jgi:hypothetical protein